MAARFSGGLLPYNLHQWLCNPSALAGRAFTGLMKMLSREGKTALMTTGRMDDEFVIRSFQCPDKMSEVVFYFFFVNIQAFANIIQCQRRVEQQLDQTLSKHGHPLTQENSK
jgi:hypothetical protein